MIPTMAPLSTNPTVISSPFLLSLLFLCLNLPPITSDKFCGTDQSNAESTCWQPCGTDADCCSLGQRCYEAGESCGSSAYVGPTHNFCGVSWCDAAYTCGTPCDGGACPDGLYCYASTPCDGRMPPPLPQEPTGSTTRFCADTLDQAKETCWQPCPRGDGDCCLGLTCFDTALSSSTSSLGECANSDYSGSNNFYCGKSWCHAAYTCGETCPGGTDNECTATGEYCYADVPCTYVRTVPNVFPPTSALTPPESYTGSGYLEGYTSTYKYCGKDPGDATERCWQDCNSDSDCCFGQYCFDAGSNCGQAFYDGPNHSYCGTSRCDAISKCSVACPLGNECPEGETCFDNTPCDSDIPSTQPFYCGLGEAEAAEKCWQPCPGGQDSECCFGQTCYNTAGACMVSVDNTINHRYCGLDKCDASYKCGTACPGGTDDECPEGESCFEDTPCSSDAAPPSFDFAYCGENAEDAAENCWQPCRNDADCCFEQTCYTNNKECGNPNFQGSAHFFCGTDFCDAAFKCGKPCPSGYDADCDVGERCFANTPCDAENASSYGLPRSAMNLALQYTPQQPSVGTILSAFWTSEIIILCMVSLQAS
ncbi:hypothetical protein ACHAWX_005264 [Stephanocyclus meneghinianus]